MLKRKLTSILLATGMLMAPLGAIGAYQLVNATAAHANNGTCSTGQSEEDEVNINNQSSGNNWFTNVNHSWYPNQTSSTPGLDYLYDLCWTVSGGGTTGHPAYGTIYLFNDGVARFLGANSNEGYVLTSSSLYETSSSADIFTFYCNSYPGNGYFKLSNNASGGWVDFFTVQDGQDDVMAAPSLWGTSDLQYNDGSFFCH